MQYPSAEDLLAAITNALAYGEIDSELSELGLNEEPGAGYYQPHGGASTGMGNRAATYVITIEAKLERDGFQCDERDCYAIFDKDDPDFADDFIEHLRTEHGWDGEAIACMLNDMAEDSEVAAD